MTENCTNGGVMIYFLFCSSTLNFLFLRIYHQSKVFHYSVLTNRRFSRVSLVGKEILCGFDVLYIRYLQMQPSAFDTYHWEEHPHFYLMFILSSLIGLSFNLILRRNMMKSSSGFVSWLPSKWQQNINVSLKAILNQAWWCAPGRHPKHPEKLIQDDCGF